MKMERYAALMNAHNVWAWAAFFGHGDLVSLIKTKLGVQLEVHYPRDIFDKDREDEMIREVTVAGAGFRWDELSDLQVDVLYITWRFE